MSPKRKSKVKRSRDGAKGPKAAPAPARPRSADLVASVPEADLAELGIDAFEFGGSMARKILFLSNRVGFKLAATPPQLEALIDFLFNQYCARTRPGHVQRSFIKAETTVGKEELAIDKDVFGIGAIAA